MRCAQSRDWAVKAAKQVRRYFLKWKGDGVLSPGKREATWFIGIAVLGAFLSIGFIACLGYLTTEQLLTPIGSMGAQAVLAFAAPQAPFSQPRNTIGGQLIAAIVGTICRLYIAVPMGCKALALPLSVSITLFFQLATRCVNPPAGGTAAILVISSKEIDDLGWGVILPVFVESCIMVFVTCVVVNVYPKRSYPKFWIRGKEPVWDEFRKAKPVAAMSSKQQTSAPSSSSAAATMEKIAQHAPTSVVEAVAETNVLAQT